MQRWQGLDERAGGLGALASSPSASSTASTAATSGSSAGPRRPRPTRACRWSSSPSTRTRTRWSGPARTRRCCADRRRAAELLGGLGVDAVCVLPFTYEFSQLGAGRVRPGRAGRPAARGRAWWWARTSGSATGPPATSPCWPSWGEVRLHGRGRAAAGRRRRDDLLHRIRGLLAAGDVAGAARGAGPPAPGRGHRRPRRTSAAGRSASPPPTWRPLPHTAIPADGVYAGWLVSLTPAAASERWPAAISVGTNPTFDGQERTRRGLRPGPRRPGPVRRARGASTSSPGSAGRTGSTRSTTLVAQMRRRRRRRPAQLTARRATASARPEAAGHAAAVPSCG